MKTYDEYMDNIQKKSKAIRKRRRIVASSLTAVFVLTLAVTLFWPYSDKLPNVKGYENSPYYTAIRGMNHASYKPLNYKNNYEWLKNKLSNLEAIDHVNDDVLYGAMPGMPSDEIGTGFNDSSTPEQSYEETTDNQVEGVIEGDLFKRSDKYLYYLRGNRLTIYSIDKENSKAINSFDVFAEEAHDVLYSHRTEMFLSADCKTLTVVSAGYDMDIRGFTVLVSFDVCDAEKVVRTNHLYFAGNYLSARMVDNEILLTYQYYVDQPEIDYTDPATFVPVYGSLEKMQPVDAEDIYCPEDPTVCRYTVVAKLDGKSLEVKDTVAILSYSQQIYVSQNNVYVTYTTTRTAEDDPYSQETVTQITGISYTGDTLEVLGTVQLEGSLENQYYMDEYNGILRVATSTLRQTYEKKVEALYYWNSPISTKRNCNLYCIDLATWQGVSAVVGFAPDGEEVTSARFDGTNAYICTAEKIVLTDPVYFFDLSDVNHITYKHTPVIDGYSSSLIDFGQHLLGIGYGENRRLKVEVYKETDDAVESVACYEREAWFVEDYKSYLIDREQNLVGIPVRDVQTLEPTYLLLHFDGEQLHVLQRIPLAVDSLARTRATVIDGYLYLLGSDLQVVKL